MGINNLRALLELYFGDALHTDGVEADFTVGTTALRILQPNIRRVEVIVTNWGAAAIALGLSNAVTNTTGWIVGSNSWVSLSWINDLDLCAKELWAISAGAGNAVHVLELRLMGEL